MWNYFVANVVVIVNVAFVIIVNIDIVVKVIANTVVDDIDAAGFVVVVVVVEIANVVCLVLLQLL